MDYDCMKIAPTARIARDATVIGNVELKADTCVLFGAVIRGDCDGRIVVGERSNVQDLACIHVPMHGETIIGDDVTIGHGAILHGCTIGDGTLIGMGSIILDGAKVGKGCMIAAGAVLTSTADIPDGSVVMGTPGRVVREVTDQDREYISEAVDEYIRIGRDLVEQGIIDEGRAPCCRR